MGIDKKCPPHYNVLKDGRCKKCADYRRVGGKKKNKCLRVRCRGRSNRGKVVNKMGKCVKCPDYKRSKDSKTCRYARCSSRSFLKKNGRCARCRKGTKPAKDKKSCI